MSFTDLERGLNTSPFSPDKRQRELMPKYSNSITIPISPTVSFGSPPSSPFTSSSPSSPPLRLPNGMQATRGNSRDSIGLENQLQPQQQKGKRPLSNAHASHPPPVSPPNSKDRSSMSSIAQHSRFIDENTRFDTPRPTMTPTTASAVAETIGTPDNTISISSHTTNGSARSPQSLVAASFQSGNQTSNYTNRVLSNNHQQRQVPSPLISPPQSPPHSSYLNQQYRGFIRVDDRGPHDSGAANNSIISATVMNSSKGGESPYACTSNSSNGIDIHQHEEVSIPIASSLSMSTSAIASSAFPISPSALQEQELDYDLMVRHLSQQIFNISSNIAVLERLVPCLGQRHKDTAEMRASLHAVLDGTQELVKSAHGFVKVLARYHQPPTIPHSGIGIGIRSQQQIELSSWQKKVLMSRKQTHQRLTKDLALVSKEFQVLQREAIEAERCQVAILRRLSSSASIKRLSLRRSGLMDLTVEEIQAGALSNNEQGSSNGYSRGSNHGNSSSFPGLHVLQNHDRELSIQEEALLKELLAMDSELAMQETILQERESEIRKIEEGMVQVLDVMKELGTLVHEQRGDVDFLQDNIMQVRGRIQQGQQEIVKASEHQRRSREKLCYIIMIVSTVTAIVLLAFVST
ncbi:hypothetical protein FBU30_009404 [Linnemannia zychae]|nr:hypothetical protein FBU30_009404 [Linnemannia zychae]